MKHVPKNRMERFCEAFLRSQNLSQAAAEAGVEHPQALLKQPACRKNLEELRSLLDQQLKPGDVLRRMAALAFGRANDCVRLVLDPDAELEQLDLSLLSEVKRSEKGAVEVRLVDRVELLRLLIEKVEAPSDLAEDFLRAMQADSDV